MSQSPVYRLAFFELPTYGLKPTTAGIFAPVLSSNVFLLKAIVKVQYCVTARSWATLHLYLGNFGLTKNIGATILATPVRSPERSRLPVWTQRAA